MKAIIVLDGISAGKTQFIETAKEHGQWVWNLNPKNVLSMLAHKLGWNGTRDKNYYNFLDEFLELANHYFDFENNYINGMIDKFMDNDKATLLIIHNANEDMSKRLQDELENCFNVLITDKNLQDDTYCKTLNLKSETYIEDILNVLKTMTKDFNQEDK